VKGLRVLHLPVNVASHMSATVRGLREEGVDAVGIAVLGAHAVVDDEGISVLSRAPTRRSARWALDAARGAPRLAREIARADVLHWYMTPGLPAGADLRFARSLGKPGVVEFAGGDVRKPSIESADNPYYAAALPGYEYRDWETDANSQATQERFASAGCEALVSCPSLLPYLDRGVFPQPHLVRQRLVVADFAPSYPSPTRKRPLVVHATTAPVGKGTAVVLDAVERLRDEIDFEFRLLEGVPHAEALDVVRAADVYLDQFVVGAHGAAALEAMALGTPVVGYVKAAVAAAYPDDLPLVNSRPEELAEVLRRLLLDGERRAALGRLSRAYVERHHDAGRLARELIDVYDEVIRRRRAGEAKPEGA
jgi:glycosyltransferase involved in cell wall biosynthesis